MIGLGTASFHLGTNREGDWWQGSRPVREVKVDAFCIDRTEVTVAAYKACVDAGACKPPLAGPKNDDWVDKACNQLLPERMSHPVNCIDWDRADTYCRWAGKRLPREEEWQLAAGRMDGRKFVWGDAPPGPDKANLRGADGEVDDPLYPQNDGWRFTAPVGSFPADRSPFGVLDMGGNVSEWNATEVENRLHLVVGGSYSLRTANDDELRARAGAKTSHSGGWLGVRCAGSSAR
jgi:formylglycine-generating enzyme required for sulfatase activity